MKGYIPPHSSVTDSSVSEVTLLKKPSFSANTNSSSTALTPFSKVFQLPTMKKQVKEGRRSTPLKTDN